MPCIQCDDGKWKWGERGRCVFDTLEDCQRAARAIQAEEKASIAGHSNQKEQVLQELIYARLEAKHSRSIAFEIARTMRKAAKNYGKPMYLEDAIAEHQVRVSKRLDSLWNDASESMVNHINRVAQKNNGVDKTPLAAKIAADWIASYGAQKITQVIDTTRNDIISIIKGGIDAGLPEIDLAELIRKAAPTKSMARAATIARTEVVAASQNAAYTTASAIGVPMVKRWVASGGERTRESHQIANGQVVGIHDKFTVGNSLLMHPGDPNGEAGEIINCRCACVYEIADAVNTQPSAVGVAGESQEQQAPVISFGAGAVFDSYVVDISDDAKRVIDRLPKPLEIKSKGALKGGSYYVRGKNLSDGKIGTLVVNKTKDPRMIFLHEYGHHIDFVLSGKHGQSVTDSQTSMRKAFLDARVQDAAHLKQVFAGKNILAELAKKVAGNNALSGFSDIVDSMSFGVFYDKYKMVGHGAKYYNRKRISGKTAAQVREINKSLQQTETFAQMYQAWADDGEAWEEMQKFFPNQSKVFAETMKDYLK